MPIIETGPYTSSYLMYDAPVNEKTKEVRDMFKMDEKTGYPEKYNWRGMAKLGSSYKPSAPFLNFKSYSEEEYYSTKVFIIASMGAASAAGHWYFNYRARRPFYAKPHVFLTMLGVSSFVGLFSLEKTLEREGIKQKMFINYTEQHPERFGEIKRPKFRECLFNFTACRV